MRCFNHHESEAIGTCRACNKGLCLECVVDLGHSISCKGKCEYKAKTLDAQVTKSEVVLRTQKRNRLFMPILLSFMGAVFLVFTWSDDSPLSLGTLMGGGFMIFGIVLGWLGQRYAKELGP